MLRYDNCINCFEPLNAIERCVRCGFNNEPGKVPQGALPAFTFVNNRYLLGRVLGKGGFGITYIAKDVANNRICAIKEYMPSEYAARNDSEFSVYPLSDSKARFVFEHGKEKFIDEAKTLLKLGNNPVVVDILDYFTQYNTAYLVMEYLDGKDLRKMARENNGRLDIETIKSVFVTVASSLMEIHKMNILHRDLSPENIIITKNRRIVLIDFGAARNYVSCQNKGMSILLKPGFAPPEQYTSNGVQGPWSDVYSLCATYYNLASGKPLVDALFRYRGERQPTLYSLDCGVPRAVSDVIEKGMELDYKKRYKDFKQLLDDLEPIDSVKSRERPQSPQQVKIQAQTGSPKVPTGTSASVVPTVSFLSGDTVISQSVVPRSDILKIGRSKYGSNLVLEHDTNISRIHCFVRFDERSKTFFLSDISANGTYFEDGRRLEKSREYPIESGTRFYLATRNNMLVVMLEKQ